MVDWQFWIAMLTLVGFGNIGTFWYGYGKLNQKVDSGFHAVNTRLDRMNGVIDRHDAELGTARENIARMQGSHEASAGD